MSPRTVCAWSVVANVLLAAGAAAEPLAVFECREIIGRDWSRTLVTYQVEFKPGAARPGEVRLVDAKGQETPCQLWRLREHADGTLASARVSFHAALAAGGQYRYELLAGKPAAGPPLKVSTDGGVVTLDNGLVAIRLPGGKKRFAKALSFATDHAAAMKAIDDPPGAGLAFGPIAGIRLADGRWVGGSYFATEPIEAVRLRQQYRKEPLDVSAASAPAAAAPKVVACTGEVTEQGPLFVEARVRFVFDNGGYYQLTARVLAGDPAVRIDETMDLKTNCPPDHPLYVVMLLNDGWKAGGWRPDAAYLMTTRSKDRNEPLEAALARQGFTSRYVSLPVPYDGDGRVVTEVVPHDPWSPRAHYLGLVNSGQLAAAKGAPFVGIVPQHAGSWRAAHWVFPPKNPHLFQQLRAWKDGAVGMQWTIRAQPHSQNMLHTGEFDPDFGLTGMRSLWCLVGGLFQYHETLYPLRAEEGYVNLDNYKDWVLAWSDDTREGVALPAPASEVERSAALRQVHAAFGGADDREYKWYSHYRQAEGTEWTVEMRRLLADESVPAARRGRLRAQVAAFCSMLAEPDFNTRASMTHQGNPNMPINRFFALPFAAAVIPDHPLAKSWLDVSADVVRYKLGTNVAPGGAWAELISYYGASAPTLVHAALAGRWQKRVDDPTARLAAAPVDFTLKLLSPPDPRFGARVVPGFGHEGNLVFNQWTPAAALVRDLDPPLAAAFAWAWDQQGRPAGQQHDNGFTRLAGDQSDLLAKATPEVLRKALASTWLPGFGAVLRAHPGTPGETYVGYRQGYLASHSDTNQGDFVIYAKGAPLTVMSLFGYAMRQYPAFAKAYNEFGWHSRVRFGKQTDDGGWPGGGPVSGVHRHFFSDSADYLKGVGDYSSRFLRPDDATTRDLSAPDALRWTRQVLFLKSPRPEGPSYLVFRDSFRSLHGDPRQLPPTWWHQRTLGTKQQVAASAGGFEYTSQWGPKMDVRFLQPAVVKVESRETRATGTLYNYAARNWLKAGSPVVRKEGEANCQVEDVLTVNAAGPIPGGQDVLVVIYPRGKDAPAARCESLGDGAAKVTTPAGTDYVFANPDGLTFKADDVAFQGVAGAVRMLAGEVHLVVAEGAGTVSYKGCVLKADEPVTKVIPMEDMAKGGTIEVPAASTTIAFALDEKAGRIEQVAPGVRRQTLANGGVAYEFASDKPVRFEQGGVAFAGRRGGIVKDDQAGTVRLTMLDGERIACAGREAKECTGPYDLTFHKDKVVAVAEGPARLLMLTQPAGLTQLPCVNIGGTRYAPGTYGQWAIVPLTGGRMAFTIENLPQPPVFRSWQQW